MSKVKQESYSQRRPALTLSVLGDVDAAVLTIKTCDPEVQFEDRTRMVVTFEEFPEHAYWPNVTSIKEMIAFLGDETDDWTGEKIALHRVKTNNPQTKKATDALWIVNADEQKDVIAEYRSGAKKATRRSSKSKK